MDNQKAFQLLQKYIKNEKMIIHSLEAEAVMKALAIKLNQNSDKWSLAGLLHDIDVEITNADPKIHGQKAIEILREYNIDEEIIDAIAMHNEESSNEKRSTIFHHALAAGETITGLIHATALVYPDKKLSSVKAKSVKKRMNETKFAASVSRENILECEIIGLSIDEFIDIALKAMQSISEEIGL